MADKTPIYLDNAATTPVDPAVWAEMQPYFEHFTANPSSIHSHGRQAKVAVEKAVADKARTKAEMRFMGVVPEGDEQKMG